MRKILLHNSIQNTKIQISARFYNQKTAIIYNREQFLNKRLFLYHTKPFILHKNHRQKTAITKDVFCIIFT